MHRLLYIAEIFHLICDEVDGAALAVLARCCTTFHEPAIQVYWYSIPDFIPLVRCFPADAVEFKGDDRLLSLVRPLEPEDWVTFVKYSKLVRHIGTREGTLWAIPDDVKLDDQFLQQLGDSASRRMLALLPNLISFDWAGCRLPPFDLSRTLCLLGSRVKIVRITEWREEKGPLIEALLLLGHYFPQLQVLELRRSKPEMPKEGEEEENWFLYGFGFYPKRRPYVPYSSLTLPGAYRLRVLTHLDCSAIPISETTFQVLCQLPVLTSLSIHLPPSLAWTGTNKSSEVFRKLRDLTITGTQKDYCAFGAVFLFPQIEALHLRIDGMLWEEDDIPDILSTIERQCSPTVLTTLSVRTSESTLIPPLRRWRESVAWVYEDYIQQMFCFSNLVTFELGLHCTYKLKASIYADIVHAWPRLEQLSIGNNRYAAHRRPPSIQKVLRPFVHHSNLTRLEVTFNGTSPLKPDEVANMLPNRSRSSSHVTSFSSIHSPIEEPEAIAALLVRIFPDLKEVHYDDSLFWSEIRWEKVSDMVPWFSMIQNIGHAP